MTTLAVELAVFIAIFYAAFRYWPWPLLQRMMDARQEQIGLALSSAEAARVDAASADAEREAALEAGRVLANEIVEQATHNAATLKAEAEARAQSEYDRIIAHAHAEVNLARHRAVEEAASELGEVVMAVVEKVIDREFDARAHNELLGEAVEALDATAASQPSGSL